MQYKRILQILTLVWCFNIKIYTTYAVQGLNEHKVNLSNYLLASILATANVTDNFLIAPQEIIKLHESLLNGIDYDNIIVAKDDMQQKQQENEEEENHIDNQADEHEYFSEKERITIPIIVTNTLQGENGMNADDFRAYNIRNTTTTMQSSHSTTSSLATATTSHNHKRFQLINAITLKSRWAFNFQKHDTHKHLFYRTAQSHVYVESMLKDDMFPYASLNHLNATALELALHQHRYDELKMLILLPNDVEGLSQLQRQLCMNLSLIDEIVEQLLRPTFVRLFLPKFKITFNIELNQVFQELVDINLVRNVTLNSNISNIYQKTHIELNEDGIGDLERRMVLFWNAYSSLRSIPISFDINHPFLFIIRNKKGIQLIGHLAKF